MSMRGVERVFQVPRQCLATWLQEEAETLPDLETRLAEPAGEDALALEE
ncbi:MAG: hypothetical protein Q9O62_01650 [Ardenticatenia bacterium]|nr:hypothetical protein [Ardenticatenia bacterium]